MALLLLISLPTFVPAIHELLHDHSHSHYQCTATSSDNHLHASHQDCTLCKYLTSLTFFNESSPLPLETQLPQGILPDQHADPCTAFASGAHFLRGPPIEIV